MQKTIFVPLFPMDHVDVRQRVIARAPLWGAIGIADCAKYLGFYVGPGRGTRTWDTIMNKYLERAAIWSKLGAGFLHSMEAYKVFIASVIMFCAQLDALPPDFFRPRVRGDPCVTSRPLSLDRPPDCEGDALNWNAIWADGY